MIARVPSGQLPLAFEHEPSHLEDDFIEGQGNRLALAHIRAWPRWPHPLTLLVGPAKSGKSHLARIWAARAGAQPVLPGTVATFTAALAPGLLLIEDIDRAGFTEAPLFHLVNRALRDGRPTLMTAREPIASWPFATDDLKSRARLATHFALAQSDDILLSQMFVKLFGDRQVTVDPQVITYLVKRMERSPEEAVELADLADRLALARGSAITRAIAAEALAARGIAGVAYELEGEGDE